MPTWVKLARYHVNFVNTHRIAGPDDRGEIPWLVEIFRQYREIRLPPVQYFIQPLPAIRCHGRGAVNYSRGALPALPRNICRALNAPGTAWQSSNAGNTRISVLSR